MEPKSDQKEDNRKQFMLPVCGLDEKTSSHTLWNFPTVEDTWCQASIKI